jgi:hypothetical protein
MHYNEYYTFDLWLDDRPSEDDIGQAQRGGGQLEADGREDGRTGLEVLPSSLP